MLTAARTDTNVTANVNVTANFAAPVVTNTNDSGVNSLRQALLDAQDGDTITFNIPTGDSGYSAGVWTITLTDWRTSGRQERHNQRTRGRYSHRAARSQCDSVPDFPRQLRQSSRSQRRRRHLTRSHDRRNDY